MAASWQPSAEMKLELAIALVKARAGSQAEGHHWKKKAKRLKQELLSLKQDLHEMEGGAVLDKLPLLGPCKCIFFSAEGDKLSGSNIVAPISNDDHVRRTSVQRFLRNVRILSRVKQHQKGLSDGTGQLSMVVDFVIDMSSKIGPNAKGKFFETYMHQAVEFIKAEVRILCGILDTIRQVLEKNKEDQLVADKIISKLILELVGHILRFSSEKDIKGGGIDLRVWNQQFLLEVAVIPYIGQRLLLASSRQIALILERLLYMDPFDSGVSQAYENSFFMFQLVERLLVAHVYAWAKDGSLDQGLLEEWVTCHFQTAALHGLKDWSSVYVVFMDRITAELIKQLHSIAALDERVQDNWHQTLLHLVASATSAVADP